MNIPLMQDTVLELLETDGASISVIGVLLAVCGLLIYDKIRQEKKSEGHHVEAEKKYDELVTRHDKEQNDNKDLLIELVRSGILATEKNTQAINTIKDAIERR